MIKLLMNLKKSSLYIVVIVLLLCVQAWADLSLPDFTSKIVNIGIQQGGIENPTPGQIRKSEMDNLLVFTKDDDKILDYYVLDGDLYKVKELNKEEQEELNNIITKPFMILSNINNEEMAESIKTQIFQNMGDILNTPSQTLQYNISLEILQNMSLIDIIKNMPEEQLDVMVSKVSTSIESMNESILRQAAINAVKEEYKQIGIDTDKLQSKYIFLTGLQMLGIAGISMISAVIIILLSSRVAAELGRILRDKVFNKVMSFSTKEFREYSTASLITRSTNDIQHIQNMLTMMFRIVVYAPIMGIGGILHVLNASNNSMTWIIALAVAAILLIVITLFIVAMPTFKKLQDLIDKLNLVSREILSGIPVIRAFNTEKREEKRFDDANKDLMKANIFVNRTMSLMMPVLMLIMNGISLLIIWVGGHKVDQGIMQVGDMMAFIQYTIQIVTSFLFVSMISIILPRASVSAKRINEILDTEPSIKNKKEIKRFKDDKKGLVEFKNVCFKYPDADTEILTDITFTAKPGETTAIIGTTGSGKSTVVNLIPRFYDITRGELLIDGVNIKDAPIKELRKRVGFVPQKGVLFSGTIESNIKYGNHEMSDEDMIRASRIAQAEEFILAKDKQYKSEISQGGNNVSGGQKQRLSIARAIATNPEIIVFDDSFSALDLKTDSKLREALEKEISGKTIIIVAQRISTIMNAEQIIVLEEGKIVGKGTHKELLDNCYTYKQIALSQLSEEELDGKNKEVK